MLKLGQGNYVCCVCRRLVNACASSSATYCLAAFFLEIDKLSSTCLYIMFFLQALVCVAE